MNRTFEGIVSWFWLAWGVVRAAVGDIGRHWMMASFSLVAGFGVWFAIQDVENPRTTRDVPAFPAGQGIPIEGRNVPEGYLFPGGTVQQIRVEARERDVEELVADDFEAWVDLSDVDPSTATDVDIEVESRREGVRAVEALPSSVLRVQLVKAESLEDVPVQMHTSGALPDGYELAVNETEIEPAFVTLTGSAAQIARVSAVELDVNLNGRRDEQSTFEGDLVARDSSGNAVTVTIDPPRAKVTMAIKQTFSQRQLPVVAPITGHPAAGYEIARITYEPSNVLVSGLTSVVDELSEVSIDAVDVGGATTNVTQTRQIRIPNTSVDPTTVVVRVEIRPVECDLAQGESRGCATRTFAVGVTLQAPPSGLTYAPGAYMTQVYVTGSLTSLNDVAAEDFVASASLATGTAGPASYQVAVVLRDGVPPDIRVDDVNPVTVTLIAGP